MDPTNLPTNPTAANDWAVFFQTTGGWGVAVVVGFVLGSVIVILAKKYENYRNNSEDLLRMIIKDQTELLTQNKIQNDRIIELSTKINTRLEK